MHRVNCMNVQRLSDVFVSTQVDALIAASPENVFYTSGIMLINNLPNRDRLVFTIVWPDLNVTAVVCSIEESLVRQEAWVEDVRFYTEFVTLPTQLLAEVIKDRRIQNGRLALEQGYVRERYFRELREQLPGAVWSDATPLFDQVRMVKTHGEVQALRRAAELTSQMLLTVLRDVQPGWSEQQVTIHVARALGSTGADGTRVIAAAGPNILRLYHRPTLRPIEASELLRVDVRANFGGYCSDIARTIIVGAGRDDLEDDYRALVSARAKGLEAIMPGRPVADMAIASTRALDETTLTPVRSSMGHAFSLGSWERPILHQHSRDRFEDGMVLCIEPIGTHATDLFHVEDMVLVTNQGIDLLSNACPMSLTF